MDRLEQLLSEIRKRPGIYIGQPSLTRLKAFIDGYIYRFNESEEVKITFYKGFNNYILEKFSINSSHSWASVILFYKDDEKDAFYAFFELLDEYKTTN